MRMDEYLRTVTEQVRCSRMHDSIAEELKDHILDQAEAFEEEGTDHEQALELAVREMGDPVETGVALDRVHRPHMSVEMLVLVSLIQCVKPCVLWIHASLCRRCFHKWNGVLVSTAGEIYHDRIFADASGLPD